MTKRKERQEIIETKKRKKTLTITFEYQKDSLVPDAIDVDGTQCTLAEMTLGLFRLYATLHDSDPTLFLATAYERVIEYGLESGRFRKQGARNGSKKHS